MKDFVFPPSVQGDLFNYLKPDQQKTIRPILRLVKRPYQSILCVALLDYLEGNGFQPIDEPVLNQMQKSIIEVCQLRPLTSLNPQPSTLNSKPSTLKSMIKKDFNSVNLACVMQQESEITNKPISGQLSLSSQGGLKFEQTVTTEKRYIRNPHLFEGKYINIGRNKDGEIILNFRKLKDTQSPSSQFDPRDYAFGVYTELLNVLPTLSEQ